VGGGGDNFDKIGFNKIMTLVRLNKESVSKMMKEKKF
jgi:hypothetical protein